MIGQTISHYEIVEKLGEGGMGTVYRARDVRLDRDVALKFLAAHYQRDENSRRRFIREAKAAAALNHTNICTVYEIDEHDELVFIVMAFIDGESLEKRIARGPLKAVDALEIARQAADGLREAHSHGVVHRDIKPSNLMLSARADGPPKVTVMDFGLAQITQRSRLTSTRITLGTIAYMSPEQTSGGEVDHRTDLWSLGVVLYEMLAGGQPFLGHYDQAVMYSIMEEDPEPLTALRAGLPIELDWIVTKALAKDAAARYQSAAELMIDVATLRQRCETGVAQILPPRLGGRGAGSAFVERWKQWARSPIASARGNPKLAAAIFLWVAALVPAAWALSRWFGPADEVSVSLAGLTARQLTFDSGLSYQPAISPDGKLVAFASDRSGEGNLDIWVKHLNGGEPIRLTTHGADDSEPAFSPDGGRIAFRSERDRGGIYVVPVLGGESRLLAPNGRGPEYSPDGRLVAYWVGQVSSSFTGEIYVVPSEGGAARRIQPQFPLARNPIWLDDGKRLLFAAVDAEGKKGWRLAPVEGEDSAILVERSDELLSGLFAEGPYPGARQGPAVLFARTAGSASGIWRLEFSPQNGRLRGPWQRLTIGSGRDEDPSTSAGGSIVFSSVVRSVDIFEAPLAASDGLVTGPLRAVTQRVSGDTAPSTSGDGKLLAFDSNRAGNGDIWLKNLETGQESPITVALTQEGLPKISADGTKIAFRRTFNGVASVIVTGIDGSGAETICQDCSGPYDWSADGKAVIVRPAAKTSSMMLTPVDHSPPRALLTHPSVVLYESRVSPEGGWLGFHAMASSTTRQIFIARIHPDREAPQDEWIAVTDGSQMDRNVAWAPAGDRLYFLSERDGFRCIWSQALNPVTKTPEGGASGVLHFHQARQSMIDAGFTLDVRQDKLYVALTSTAANVWMLEPAPQSR